MTYEEFKKKYNGKYVDVDNYPSNWKYQCFDLVQLYNREVIDVPDYVLAECGVVKNLIYDKKQRAEMDEYFNEVSTIGMQQGDVCIWGNGDAGHIAIFDHYNPQDNNCYYFSQNPNPSQVMVINLPDHHAFRRKAKQEVAPNVPRDENKTQIKVKVPNLNVRIEAGHWAGIIGYARQGIYDILQTYDFDGYTWYKIAEHQWIAYSPEWEEILPAKKKDEYKQFKVISKKDGYVEIDLGTVFVKE